MENLTSTLTEHVEDVVKRRLMNEEYQRGYMEGQHQAALEFAEIVDRLLSRYDHIAVAGKIVYPRQQIF